MQRQPATDLRTVLNIACPKNPSEMGLLVKYDDKMEAHSHAEAINSERQRMKQQRPAEDDQKHAKVHGIAGVPVEATYDQAFGWINGCGGPASVGGKIPQTPEVDSATSEQKEGTGNCTNGDLGTYVREHKEGDVD